MCHYIPQARHLGVHLVALDDQEITLCPPYRKELVGQRDLRMDYSAAALHLIAKIEQTVIPKTTNFSLDYLRPTRLQDTYAQCALTRQGRQVANVSITAWQERRDRPCAIARAHFLIPEQ
ncbi:PaaI family thioesterase [Seongchinamella unica]|uniref:PaaI family thioesterase n=2 Tax=Seongchinamella unica TaxID=2547392 RepID=A0A4R5LX36_9GAMM|nr:PaaI family thioesterase [Seongchinamella unica]